MSADDDQFKASLEYIRQLQQESRDKAREASREAAGRRSDERPDRELDDATVPLLPDHAAQVKRDAATLGGMLRRSGVGQWHASTSLMDDG